MYFDGDPANNTQRMDVKFFSSILTADRQIKDTGEARFLETSQLNLNYVNFETTPSLKFFGTDNQINLIDSRVRFNTTPQFLSTAPLTINVNDPSGNGTESSFLNFSGNIFPTSTTINIENGNTLTFEDSGRVFASTNAERLYFGSPVIGNVNNGTLKIDTSNVYFNSTSFDFTNGSTLNTVGSDSSVEFRGVSFDNSLMDLGNNTSVTARDLNLEGTYISLGSGAKINASNVVVKGGGFPTTLSGGANNAGIDADFSFSIERGATFQQQDSSRVNGGRDLVLLPDATLSINTDSVFIASTIVGIPDSTDPAKTSTVDVNTGGTFILTTGQSDVGRQIAFDVDGTSFLRVGSNGLLELGFNRRKTSTGAILVDRNRGKISVQNDGQIDLDGYLYGIGTIAGSGKFLINNSGQIAPGWDLSLKTATITFENEVEFTNFGTSSNRSRYLVDVDVVGGIPSNDLLQYDNQSFDITNLESIGVNAASGRTADELDGQVFTIISSVDAGSTGTLVTGGSYPAIVEGGDIPALIDFTISNNNTNGNDDVTLLGEKDLDQLLKNPSVKPSHALTTSATTTAAPGPGQSTTTIVTLVPAQTIPTGTSSTSTTTVDPSTGNTILTKVTVAPNPAGGESHQQTIDTTVTTPTGTVVAQSTQTKLLKAPKAPGTAHKMITTHTTSTANSIVSTVASKLPDTTPPPAQLTTTATTAVAPGTGQATTTIVTLVPAQTIPTGTSSTSTTTVEPSTGNTILTKVTVAPNPAGGESHQQTIDTTITTPTGTVVDQSKVISPLKTPDIPGTAHQVTTTHVISTTGSLVSTNTSTTIEPKVTGTANLSSAANLLVNSAKTGNSQSQTALNNLTNAQVTSHLDSIHAEPYSSYMTISLEHSDMVMNTVLNHAASSGHVSTGRTGEAEEKQTGKHFWMEASYNEGDVNGDGDLGDFDYNLSSLTVGQDLVASDDRALGIYFSFGTQEMDEHDKVIQDFDGDVYHLGIYLNQADIGGWDFRGVLGYAYGDHSSKRRVFLSGTSATPSADYDSHSAYVGVKGTVTGYQNNWVTLSPELGFNYIYYKQESFKESGDPNLALTLDSADAHAIIASAGLNARFASFSDSVSVYPLAFARYEHDFYANANNEHEVDAALVAHPDYKQTFVGQNRGEHALITGLGLGSDITSALQINGGFVHSENSHGSEWGAGLNLEYLW
jgi:uncharacterized protein YhjY with autotransporter beta-barrel domain